MSWAGKRRTLYGGLVALFLMLLIGIPSFIFLYEKPTCFDGIQNQGELGIDKGGPCLLLHKSQVQNIAILWARSFEVVPGIYNAVSQIDNPNFSAGAVDVPYSFKLFDSSNLLIAERKGKTYISPNKLIPVFEGTISTGNRVPTRTFFELLEEPNWIRVDNPIEGLNVENWSLSNRDTAPRIDAKIENKSFEDIYNIEVVATVFNSSGVAIAASRTIIEVLSKQSSYEVTFTWPQKFSDSVSRVEIIPRADFHD